MLRLVMSSLCWCYILDEPLGSYFQCWVVGSILTVKAYGCHLLLLCSLSFMYADCVVFVTLYIRRDSCSLSYGKVGCCLFYPRSTGFTPGVYLVAFVLIPTLHWFVYVMSLGAVNFCAITQHELFLCQLA